MFIDLQIFIVVAVVERFTHSKQASSARLASN